MINIGWWCYMPILEAKGALGSVPIIYHCYIISATLAPYLRTNSYTNPPNPSPFRPPSHIPSLDLYLYLSSRLPPTGPQNTNPPAPTTAWGPVITASATPPKKV